MKSNTGGGYCYLVPHRCRLTRSQTGSNDQGITSNGLLARRLVFLLSCSVSGCGGTKTPQQPAQGQNTCRIEGVVYGSGGANPENACEICYPAVDGTAWSRVPVGQSCGVDRVCTGAGHCEEGCYIGGELYRSGDPSSANPCHQCNPTATTFAWSLRAQGASCGAGMTCDAFGVCGEDECTAECAGHCGPGARTPRDTVQIFYYPWYGSESQDGLWRHWRSDRRIGGGTYEPDADDLPSPFFPSLGPYSSTDSDVIDQHMDWIVEAGIGVVVTSWWGRDSFENDIVWDILHAADDRALKVAFYIEPYKGGYVRDNGTKGSRTPQTAKEDIEYLIDEYGCHRALHRIDGRPVFLFFAARTYMDGQGHDDWKDAWDELHADPEYNPIVISHDTILESRIVAGGWDGGHDYGCGAAVTRHEDWPQLAAQYAEANKLLYFTVCPGYDKSRLSPGTDPVISREKGALYDRLWQAAIDSPTKPAAVVITSFNEWHEGTSIEPAVPKSIDGYTYEDYEGAWGLSGQSAAKAYVTRTRQLSDQFLALP